MFKYRPKKSGGGGGGIHKEKKTQKTHNTDNVQIYNYSDTVSD